MKENIFCISASKMNRIESLFKQYCLNRQVIIFTQGGQLAYLYWLEETLEADVNNLGKTSRSYQYNMQIETNQAGIKDPQILSSTMAFSSKNTENNSIEAQSILIEGSHIPRVIDSSQRSSQTPQESDNQNPRFVYKSNQSSSFYKQKSQMSIPPEDGMVNRYKEIERILQGENMNLKDQNNLFLLEINRLRQINGKYKKIDRLQKLQLQQLKEECEAERRRADELKQIVMARMIVLEDRMKDGYSLDKSSFLEEMLEFSKDFNQ